MYKLNVFQKMATMVVATTHSAAFVVVVESKEEHKDMLYEFISNHLEFFSCDLVKYLLFHS